MYIYVHGDIKICLTEEYSHNDLRIIYYNYVLIFN